MMNQTTFYIGAAIFLALSYAIAYYAMNETPIRSKSDLHVVTAKLRYYSFQQKDEGVESRVGYRPYVELQGFHNRFQIPNHVRHLFKTEKFLQFVNINDNITVQIRKRDKKKLNNGRRINVYSMHKGARAFLSLKDTIYEEQFSKYIFKPFAAVLFMALGILCAIYGRKLWIRADREMRGNLPPQ